MVNCNDAIQIPGIRVNDRAVMNGAQGKKPVTWRAAIAGVVISAVEHLALLQARARDRSALKILDDRALRDIGVTRADIDQELAKPFLSDFPRRC